MSFYYMQYMQGGRQVCGRMEMQKRLLPRFALRQQPLFLYPLLWGKIEHIKKHTPYLPPALHHPPPERTAVYTRKFHVLRLRLPFYQYGVP